MKISEFISKTDDNDIRIGFKDILLITNDVDLAEYEIVNIKKRIFKNRIDELVLALQHILDELQLSKEFYEEYFKFVILSKRRTNKEDFEKSILNILNMLKAPLNNFIETKVDPEAYKNTKDIETMDSVSKRELYFSEDHLKQVLKVSIVSKLLFIYGGNIENPKHKKLLNDLVWNFDYSDNKINILNKVQKIVFSRLLAVVYSDKRFWTIAKLHGIKPTSFANNLFLKITGEMVIFFDHNTNPIPFIDVFVNRNIQWLKQKKFYLSYDVVNPYKQEEKFEAYQRASSNNYKNNKVMTNFLINEEINDFIKTELSSYLREEKFYNLRIIIRDNFKKNTIHQNVVFPLVSKKTGISVQRLLLVDREIFSYLILWTFIQLVENNLFLLGKMLVSNIESDKFNIDKASLDKYKTIQVLTEEPEYKNLIDTKYPDFKNVIAEEGYILKLVALMYYNKFKPFVEYKNEPQYLKFSLTNITKEFFRFLKILL